MTMTTGVRNDSRTIFGWAMYDWANSAYITAGSLVFAILFSEVIYPSDGLTIGGTTIGAEAFFGIIVGVGALLLFLAMPVLGAVADYTDSKKQLLRIFAYTGAFFAVLTALPGEGDLLLAVVLALFAQIGFAAANVMYDGFLPEITSPDTVDQVSAKGFAYGYAGGGHRVASNYENHFQKQHQGQQPRSDPHARMQPTSFLVDRSATEVQHHHHE